MKFLAALALSLALALATSPQLFTQEAGGGKPAMPILKVAPKAGKNQGYSLAPQEGDTAGALRFKAALRLLNGYTVTMNRLNGCVRGAAATADMQKTRAAFFARNGSTLGQVMNHLKKSGGLTPEIRQALDKEADRLQKADSRGCRLFMDDVAAGREDLYKGAKYVGDYKLLRGRDR